MDDDKILWKKIPCCCEPNNVAKSHPFIKCIHCKYQQAENSIPKESFTIRVPILNKNGKQEGSTTRIIKEITLKRGSHDDVIGWEFS